jgi:hypothetical protein
METEVLSLGSPSGVANPTEAPNMLRQHVVDERLVTQSSLLRFPAHGSENRRVDPNRDESPALNAQGRSSYPTHRSELLSRGFRNLREVNPSTPPRRPRALCGSLGAR